MDSLHITIDNAQSGDLVFENNEYIFNYTTKEVKKYISLTMPVREKSYIHSKLHPIFVMHLPEGYLLSVIKKHF